MINSWPDGRKVVCPSNGASSSRSCPVDFAFGRRFESNSGQSDVRMTCRIAVNRPGNIIADMVARCCRIETRFTSSALASANRKARKKDRAVQPGLDQENGRTYGTTIR